MAVGKRKQLKLKQPQRGSIDVKCPKLDELNGNSVPFCSHGPTLLFERTTGQAPTTERFYACSVYRDRKKCRFYQGADKTAPEDGEKQLRERKLCNQLFQPKHRDLHNRLKAFKELKGNQRRFCSECSKLVMPEEVNDHKGHKVLVGIHDKQLKSPSTLLQSLSDKDGAAQFWFSPKCVKFFTSTIKSLQFDSVLCVGAPRIHEGIIGLGKKRIRSFLLDFDYRLAQFWSPLQYGPYNFMTHHFYTKLAEKAYRTFLAKSKRLLIVIDPPFGAMIEPIAHSLELIKKDCENERTSCEKMEDEILPRCTELMLIFPYFGEKRIKDSLGEDNIVMLDFKVEYDNHPLFRSAAITGKRVSPIRIFTSIKPDLIPLSAAEGYKLCEICQRYVSSENKHCRECNSCTTKFGRTYVHCKRCGRCRKPSYEHCGKCGKCHLPAAGCPTTPLCSICNSADHKRSDCPVKMEAKVKEEDEEVPMPKTKKNKAKRPRRE